ncbi:hypothetical protein Y032_0126g1314 [Ancylostoma ceylanicum]|uniref:Saposin B-type domain-containing protein n=2 Tax=Ancylostoma ceylanicum TaxID=53326 RepID=A0A016T8H0_9BILA|nr:hypothetical protein Y032_0126g1314 [Ancylostoma ceylanicum]
MSLSGALELFVLVVVTLHASMHLEEQTMNVCTLPLLAVTLFVCSADINELDMDNALCNMCKGDERCLTNLMTRLRIRRCVVEGQMRVIAKRFEPGQLREILLDSYLRKLR